MVDNFLAVQGEIPCKLMINMRRQMKLISRIIEIHILKITQIKNKKDIKTS